MSTVHIIGAGISGLAAATWLAEKHVPVKLYEATAHAGGRCRSSQAGDHGLHVLASTDGEFARYLMRIEGGALQRVRRLPLPAAPLIDYLPVLRHLLKPRGTADAALARDSQLRDGWLKPLAQAMHATPVDLLPARAWRRALWQRLRHRPHVAKDSLSAAFIQPALDYLDYHGGSIYFSHALTRIERTGDVPTALVFARKKIALAPGDVVMLATPPAFTQTLLPELALPTQPHSAITLHFHTEHQEAAGITYPDALPMDMLRYREGMISASSRVAEPLWHSDPELLAHRVWRGLQKAHHYLQGVALPRYTVWREKRAGHTVSEAPAVRPEQGALLLAGDWLDPSQPASLEAAAASGHHAAELAMAKLPTRRARQQ